MTDKHQILFYPVGNGDTSQVVLSQGRRVLFDFCHRPNAESADTPEIDIKKRLKEELGLSNIMALGYCDQKILPHYLHAKLNFDAICLKDLNWYRIPQGNAVQNFMAEEYEVIIDLTLEDRLPIQYIMAKSRARFKVGRWSDSNKRFLDMMIDMAGSRSLPQLIQQVHHYLLMVNARNEPSLN